MANLIPNGTGQSLGDSLALARPLFVSGQIWYVNSVGGVDAGGTAGLSEFAPLATLAQAITNASNNDTVVLMDGHTETIGNVNISKELIVLGGGMSGGLPTVTLNFNPAETSGLEFGTDSVEVRNVKFGTSSAANATRRVLVTGDYCKVVGCYFVCDRYDDAISLRVSGNACEIVNTTFVSTATALANQPLGAIDLGAVVASLRLNGVVVDSGAYGFSSLYPLDLSAHAVDQLMIENLSLLRGADAKIASTTTGIVHVATATGGSKVVW